MEYITSIGCLSILSAVLSGKWAMELGFNQIRQVLWMMGGFIFGPLALLTLYVRLIRKESECMNE